MSQCPEIVFEFPEVPEFNFLVDLQGESLYQKWLELGLGEGTHEDFLNWLRIKGDNGATPTIGENGNWFIAGIDTGLPSRGLQGEPLRYSDLTPEQIAELQAPALEAAQTANEAATAANNAATAANEAAEAANAVAGNIVELQQAIDLVEAQRVINEDARTQAETTRDNSETARNEAEQLRTTAEQDRDTAETSRSEAEQLRATAEGERAAAELIRIQNENERIALIGDLNTILDDINGEVI